MLTQSPGTHRRCHALIPRAGTQGLVALVLALALGRQLDARAARSQHSLWPDSAMAGLAAEAPSLSDPRMQPAELGYYLFVPMVTNRSPQQLLEIYDWYGTLQSWDWLVDRFGATWLVRGTGGAPARILREEASGQTVLIATVRRSGEPVPGIPVMFYWPDAPWLDPSLRACGLDQALVVYTNADGEAHFSMGPGSAYWPPDGGPHVVWIGGPESDCLGGLGWLGDTNHIHLNSTWELP